MIQQRCSPEASMSRLPDSDFKEIKDESEAKKTIGISWHKVDFSIIFSICLKTFQNGFCLGKKGF